MGSKNTFVIVALATLLTLSIFLFAKSNSNDDLAESDRAVTEKVANQISLGFYNVENLFDTQDDPDTDDAEFLPGSDREWTTERYADKIQKLSTVISRLGNSLPTIVGLSEIENRAVIEDLANANALKNGNYDIVHYQSSDERGIDVGMLYRKKQFKVIYSKPIFVPLPASERPTREILYVKGKVIKGPELHVFVNHWPSRYGGMEQSEFKRISAAKTLKHVIDSIKTTDADALILCMGDFNDYPYNTSIASILKSDSLNSNSELVNLMSGLERTQRGSYNYKGEWGFLDQIIVSRSLVDQVLPDVIPDSTRPFFFDDMLYINKEYGDTKTNRTYGGTKYFGGYSDHLPVYTILSY